MDDGRLRTKTRMSICSYGFSKEENEILSKEINEKFDLNSKVMIQKGKSKGITKIYYFLQFPAKDAKKINKLISPYIIDIFKYKIPVILK